MSPDAQAAVINEMVSNTILYSCTENINPQMLNLNYLFVWNDGQMPLQINGSVLVLILCCRGPFIPHSPNTNNTARL